MGLLEEATSKFKDDEGYKGDLRYLKLWCLYTQYVEDPVSVFRGLEERGVGAAYALFWEEYARVLEKMGW